MVFGQMYKYFWFDSFHRQILLPEKKYHYFSWYTLVRRSQHQRSKLGKGYNFDFTK